MGGSTKVAAPAATPSMTAQIKEWADSYPELSQKLASASETDLGNLASVLGGSGKDALSQAIASSGQVQADYGRAVEGDQAAATRELLAKQIYGDLQAGSSLTPEMSREIEQSVRAAQQARGTTGGNSAIFQEAFAKGSRGEALKTQRKNAASDFLAMNQSRPSALNALMGITDAYTMKNKDIMSPTLAANTDIFNMNETNAYNARQASAAARSERNRNIGAIGGAVLGGAAGYAIGGPMGGMAGASVGSGAGAGVGGLF